MIMTEMEIDQHIKDSMVYMLENPASEPNIVHHTRLYVSMMSSSESIRYSYILGRASLFLDHPHRKRIAHYIKGATASVDGFIDFTYREGHAKKMDTWSTNLRPVYHPYDFPVLSL